MLRKILPVLAGDCALDPTTPIVVGVSGGPDSLCLLSVLHEARYPLIAAHFNHRLRPEADLESDAVAQLALKMGLPCETDSADVAAFARGKKLSIEEAARTLRYRFLFAVARKHRAQAVAVGHTADDQAETTLMHFVRGAALSGLKGMTYRTILPVFDAQIPIVRPLLAIWRAETLAYCGERNLNPHFDPSNTDETYFRNRLRHSLIPELEKYNPQIKQALWRTAQALNGDYQVLADLLDEQWRNVFHSSGDGWLAFDLEKVNALSIPLRRNLFKRAIGTLRPGLRDVNFETLERAASGVFQLSSFDLTGGLFGFSENNLIYIAAYEADLPSAQWPQVEQDQSFAIGDRVDFGNGWTLASAEVPPAADHFSQNADNWSAWLDADLTGDRLRLGKKQAGDRFQPLGMNGRSVKLSDFFVNVKLPKRARDKWPLLIAGDQIAWVIGYRLAHPFRVTEKTRRVIHLTLGKK